MFNSAAAGAKIPVDFSAARMTRLRRRRRENPGRSPRPKGTRLVKRGTGPSVPGVPFNKKAGGDALLPTAYAPGPARPLCKPIAQPRRSPRTVPRVFPPGPPPVRARPGDSADLPFPHSQPAGSRGSIASAPLSLLLILTVVSYHVPPPLARGDLKKTAPRRGRLLSKPPKTVVFGPIRVLP